MNGIDERISYNSITSQAFRHPTAVFRVKEQSDDPRVAAYQVRYSQTPITDEWSWDRSVPVESISQVWGENIPQTFSIRGLKTSTSYHAAVRVYNETGIAGPLATTSFTTNNQDVDSGTASSGTGSNNSDTVPPNTPTNLNVQ